MTKIKLEETIVQNMNLLRALKKYGGHLSICNRNDPMNARVINGDFIPGPCNCGWQDVLDNKGDEVV